MNPMVAAAAHRAQAFVARTVAKREHGRWVFTDASVASNNFVGYQLYRDSERSLVWGATDPGNVLTATGTGADQVHQVYGQVANPSTNNPAAGNYLDTITATDLVECALLHSPSVPVASRYACPLRRRTPPGPREELSSPPRRANEVPPDLSSPRVADHR